MLEKEIKILDVNKGEIVEKLENMWAIKTFEWFIHDVYYDFPDEVMAKMESNDRIFRVRKKGETHLYTIKRKRKEKWFKVADEHEMKITDVESFSKVLEQYGMEKIRQKKKYRTSYLYEWVEFDIDDYESIPTLLEIEAKTTKEIKFYIKLLWLVNHKTKRFWSRWLYSFYGLPYSYILK